MFDKNLITESRRTSALKKDMTPLRMDSSSHFGLFAGSSGDIYETDLDKCTCPDFAIQGFMQPCKHMIRLAMELNMIPNEGMQSDVEVARGKYFVGRAKDYCRDAQFHDFVRFARAYLSLYRHGKIPSDNVFCEVLDLATIEDCLLFKFYKNGNVSVQKKWVKECDGIYTVISNRLGRELVDCLMDDRFVSFVCEV